MARRFGINIGGSNIETVDGTNYTYDIYDDVRSVARGRLRGAPSNAISRNPVGNNTVSLARCAEKVALDYNTIASTANVYFRFVVKIFTHVKRNFTRTTTRTKFY